MSRDAWDDAADGARLLEPTLAERHWQAALKWLSANPQFRWAPRLELVSDLARLVADDETEAAAGR